MLMGKRFGDEWSPPSGGGGHCRSAGGVHGYGTVFAIKPDGTEKVLHRFGGGSDGGGPVGRLANVNGTLYGVTGGGGAGEYGTVFSITSAGVYSQLYTFPGYTGDAEEPLAGLTNVKGTLYGTTYVGGAHYIGAVYSLSGL
jgi:uncharacterized repeat protein (TIGR03803 family)